MLSKAPDTQRRSRTLIGLAVGIPVVLAILTGRVWYVFHSQRAPLEVLGPPAAPVASVSIATSERRDVPVELKGIGIVQAYNTVTVKPRISGQITQVVFTEGQRIHQGDVLARIDARFLLAQLHQAQATRAKDEAQLANAKRDFARLTDVSVRGFVSRQAVDGQQAQVAMLEATVQADQAMLENTQVQLDYATVTAPIDGITGLRLIDVGNVISPSDPGIVVITQVGPIAVIFTLPRKDHRDGPDLCNRRNTRIGRRDDIADINQPQASDPVDRGRHGCVVGWTCVFSRETVGLHGGLQHGRLCLLAVYRFRQETNPRHGNVGPWGKVPLRIGPLRLVPGARGLGLMQLREQKTYMKTHLPDESVDPR